MKNLRVPEIAFVASGVSVLGSFPASIALQAPELPGIVLVVTGGVASLLSLRWWHKRQFQVLATLVVLTTAMVVLHWLWHRLGVSHDWLGPFYVGAIVVYCGVAISVTRRLLPRDMGLPRA